MNNAAVTGSALFDTPFSLPLDIYLEVSFLDNTVVLFLIVFEIFLCIKMHLK